MTDIRQDATRIARSYLEGQGAQVMEQDYTCEAGCVDLVFMEDGEMAFCTVKARQGLAMPEEDMTQKARSQMETVAAHYLANHDVPSCRVRFDVVKLSLLGEGKAFLCHHRDAFGSPSVPDAARAADAPKPARHKRTRAYER
ncbi:MAG: YraN family protein [Coriobacteriales bacterium]|jgi:putative endonuclease|nr:YraN family protein [Coriobacteriales bacterium]